MRSLTRSCSESVSRILICSWWIVGLRRSCSLHSYSLFGGSQFSHSAPFVCTVNLRSTVHGLPIVLIIANGRGEIWRIPPNSNRKNCCRNVKANAFHQCATNLTCVGRFVGRHNFAYRLTFRPCRSKGTGIRFWNSELRGFEWNICGILVWRQIRGEWEGPLDFAAVRHSIIIAVYTTISCIVIYLIEAVYFGCHRVRGDGEKCANFCHLARNDQVSL